MKTNLSRGLVLALALLAPTLRSADFTIDWWTVDGGGGTSTNGAYALTGTIGQPDAGRMSGGSYSLTGGFWSVVAAVQTPGAPTLTIHYTATNTVAVSWPSPSDGFGLQQNDDLSTSSWTTPPETVTDTGTNKVIIINPPAGKRFYRLMHP